MLLLAMGLTTARESSAGSIKGTVVLKGTTPELKKLAVTIDQYVCGKEKNSEELVVSPQGGIRSAVVWIEKPPAAAAAEALPSTAAMDQKECTFLPRVVIVPAGGKIDFLNSDRLLHNLHATPNANPAFNRTQPKGRTITISFSHPEIANPAFNRTQPKGRTITISFSHPEIIRVTCDLHSWMRAWVVVADHPFYALTDGGGAFELRGLPSGRYTLKVWQERLGTISKDVVVGDQEPTAVTLEMAAR